MSIIEYEVDCSALCIKGYKVWYPSGVILIWEFSGFLYKYTTKALL
ncbi:hypothetical protein TwortDSMZ_076 [Staphylococcus phage Twort]|uniref:Uncharacterized protein n=1 Tax=Staphylococcus phage Twort (strain DSM 17442 / HER 48) TaxID=2908167 RepID=A0A6H0X5V0_BPTWO|nr:hypothetical protein TwortDSMZ_076 [Staphylococcus phage Twort]